MARRPIVLSLGLLALAACAVLLAGRGSGSRLSADEGAKPAPTMASLQAEVDQLKKLVPDQASAMLDASQHCAQMWFAAQAENWPLAQFYWKETDTHLRWAVLIKPLRQDSAKHDIKLNDILEALENGPLKQLQAAVEAKDKEKFNTAYRFTLEGCYACHKAVEKPFLRLQIPLAPASPMINADPKAEWPK